MSLLLLGTDVEAVKHLFINYRKDDTGDAAKAIRRWLADEFPQDGVFLDAASIKPGEVWPDRLKHEVQRADVVLALIGKDWLLRNPRTQRPRIDDSDDWVSLELLEAIPKPPGSLIPVLMDGARMPANEALPANLQSVASRQAVSIRTAGAKVVLDEQAKQLLGALCERGFRPAPKPEVSRLMPRANAAVLLAVTAAVWIPPKPEPLPGLRMIPITAQEFVMGSPVGEAGRAEDEQQHRVKITKPYWIAETEVTQKQWRVVMGGDSTPWKGKDNTIEGDDVAVSYVSWNDAMEFCQRLTEREWAAGRLPIGHCYTLPTEAQWELACRAGSRSAYCFGDDVSQLGQYAVFESARSGAYAHRVKEKKPNAWWLYDMHGNVWEWCSDSGYSQLGTGERPVVVTSTYASDIDPFERNGESRINRGGSWRYPEEFSRSAHRVANLPTNADGQIGLRLALTIKGS